MRGWAESAESLRPRLSQPDGLPHPPPPPHLPHPDGRDEEVLFPAAGSAEASAGSPCEVRAAETESEAAAQFCGRRTS